MNDTSHRSSSGSSHRSTQIDRLSSFWKGLPAGLIALLGLTALVFATDRNSRLEQRYRRWAEDATKKRFELSVSILNDLQVMQSGGSNKSAEELIPADDDRRKEYDRITASERLYYEKLIALNAEVPEYRFHFANACANSNSNADRQRGMSLMETLAPHNQTGFPQAHLWWADYFSGLMRSGRLNPQVGAELIFNHADSCLRRQTDDKNALLRKGEAALVLGRNEDALNAYARLFEADPFHYKDMVMINVRLNRPEDNVDVFRSAKSRIESRLGDDMSADLWCEHWESMTVCMLGLDEFDEAESRLRSEIENQSQKNDAYKQVFLEQLLAKVIIAVHRKRNTSGTQLSMQDFEIVREAFQLDAKNSDVLLLLTQMAMSEDASLSAEAKKLYDPTQDDNAIPLVLNELGIIALAKKDYERAKIYMEKARAKQPNDWRTLNNLAYIYLVAENRDPERALKLIDEALRKIPNPDVAKEVTTFFLDTKGTALMQLNRMPEAIAAFELALKDRPEEVKILKALIKCYEALNLSSDAYQERLKKLTDK